MLFKIVAAASFLATFAAGYVIPAEALSSRSLGVVDDGVDLLVREDPPKVWHVPAGTFQGEHKYTDDHIHAAVTAAQAEHARHAGMTEEQRSRSPLKHFGNYKHTDSTSTLNPDKDERPFPKAKDGSKSKLMEYPLPNLYNSHLPGPARVVMKHQSDGSLKFAGVVSHDQARGASHAGVHDHFRIKKA